MNKKYRFCLTIANDGGYFAIFSLPQTNPYQKISSLSVTPKHTTTVKNIFDNKVVIFGLNDVKENEKIDFQQQPLVFQQTISDVWSLADYPRIHISSDRFVNGHDPTIRKLARDVVGKEKSLHQIVSKLYYFGLEYLRYGLPIDGLYDYQQAMEKRVTDCGGFSTFLMSLLQSQGIPTRLVSGFIISENLYSKLFSNFDFCTLNFDLLLMHAWFEAQLPDKSWLPLDPAMEWRRDHGLTKRAGGFGHIPADRLVVSFGHNFTLNLNKKDYNIDLLQKPVYL